MTKNSQKCYDARVITYNCIWFIILTIVAVVVAHLVERLLPIPEVCSSNPFISKKNYWTFTVNCIEKTKIKKMRPGMVHFFKKMCCKCFIGLGPAGHTWKAFLFFSHRLTFVVFRPKTATADINIKRTLLLWRRQVLNLTTLKSITRAASETTRYPYRTDSNLMELLSSQKLSRERPPFNIKVGCFVHLF